MSLIETSMSILTKGSQADKKRTEVLNDVDVLEVFQQFNLPLQGVSHR